MAFFAGWVNRDIYLYRSTVLSLLLDRSVNNKLGSKLTLLLGSFGYCLFIGSYL